MSPLARRLRLALVAAPLVVLGACAVTTDDQPVELSDELFERVIETTTTTTTTTTPSSDTRTVTEYFVCRIDDIAELVSVERELPVTAGSQQVLSDLFTNPPESADASDECDADEGGELTSSIPPSAELLGATLSPGSQVLIVNADGLIGEGGIQGTELRNALAQIVHTATESPDVLEVSFRNNGEQVQVITGTGETTDDAVDESDYETLG